MNDSVERFLKEVCARRVQVTWIFTVALLFALLHVPYLFVVEWGSALSVISTVNFVGLTGFTLASGLVLLYCNRNEE